MRKLNILLSIVLMIFTIVGCSGESDNNNGTEILGGTASNPTILDSNAKDVVSFDSEHNYFKYTGTEDTIIKIILNRELTRAESLSISMSGRSYISFYNEQLEVMDRYSSNSFKLLYDGIFFIKVGYPDGGTFSFIEIKP